MTPRMSTLQLFYSGVIESVDRVITVSSVLDHILSDVTRVKAPTLIAKLIDTLLWGSDTNLPHDLNI